MTSDEILLTLNRELESAFFKEEDGKALIKDGIEMSICVIDRKIDADGVLRSFSPGIYRPQ